MHEDLIEATERDALKGAVLAVNALSKLTARHPAHAVALLDRALQDPCLASSRLARLALQVELDAWKKKIMEGS